MKLLLSLLLSLLLIPGYAEKSPAVEALRGKYEALKTGGKIAEAEAAKQELVATEKAEKDAERALRLNDERQRREVQNAAKEKRHILERQLKDLQKALEAQKNNQDATSAARSQEAITKLEAEMSQLKIFSKREENLRKAAKHLREAGMDQMARDVEAVLAKGQPAKPEIKKALDLPQ